MQLPSEIQQLIAAGQYAEAEERLNRLRAQQPRNADICQLLGLIFTQTGRTLEAINILKQAVFTAPQIAAYRHNLAMACLSCSEYQEAIRHFRDAIRLDRNYHASYLGLCVASIQNLDSAGGVKAAEAGLKIKPDWPELLMSYADALKAGGQMKEATAVLEQARLRFPHHSLICSNYLYQLQFFENERSDLQKKHEEVMQKFITSKTTSPIASSPNHDATGIKLGILSGDLKTHSVAHFVQALFNHKPPGIQLIVFNSGSIGAEDTYRQFFREKSDGWFDVMYMDSHKLMSCIADQHLDVLFELSGHTSLNRLDSIHVNSAKVILSGIGYPHSTGHPHIQFRLTDQLTEPPELFSGNEKAIYMSPSFLCYTPPDITANPEWPDPTVPFTFGCFNNGQKINQSLIGMWAEILQNAPEARLLIKFKGAGDPSWRDWIAQHFKDHGIAFKRIKLMPYLNDRASHFNTYNRVHLSLDTFPYHGTTTTFESLWMGVPVVSLKGDRHASRVSTGLLHNLGLNDFIAENKDQYIRICLQHYRSRERLHELRTKLRTILTESLLCNQAEYAGQFYSKITSLAQTENRPSY